MKPSKTQDPSGEFDLIAACFAPLAGEGAFCLTDDAACLAAVPDRFKQVISTDTLVENVHFLSDDLPDTIGKKALRVNLSDCAAMGATPTAYLLNLSLPPERGLDWVRRLAEGLASDQDTFSITLLGGDTTRTVGPVVISITVIGMVESKWLLRRGGAKPGDEIWVTGAIGEGHLGLTSLQGALNDPDGFFRGRYQCPEPRVGVLPAGIATSCLDISDGLVQDAGHIARQSRVKMTIWADKVPLSDRLSPAQRGALLEACLTGGDDYELLFTCAPGHREHLAAAACASGVPMTQIGIVSPGESEVVVVKDDGTPLTFASQGWQHF